MNAHAYYMEARSAFRIGTTGIGVEAALDHAPSDTLFSALCAQVQLQNSNGLLEELLVLFKNGQPPFLLSGAFPYVKLEAVPQGQTDPEQRLRFFPAPLSMRLLEGGDPPIKDREGKTLKPRKARWISETLFKKFIDNPQVGSLEGAKAVDGSQVWMTQEEHDLLPRDFEDRPVWWRLDSATRVAVDRVYNASEVYQAGRLSFPPGGGLWCAVQIIDERQYSWNALAELLDILGDSGLGSERSAGYGRYTGYKSVIDLPEPPPGGIFVTLSHYYPTEAEFKLLAEPNAAYELSLRRGIMGSPDNQNFVRKQVQMLVAGSVLPANEHGVYGGLADVTPNIFTSHPVYRYGYAFPVGIGATS